VHAPRSSSTPLLTRQPSAISPPSLCLLLSAINYHPIPEARKSSLHRPDYISVRSRARDQSMFPSCRLPLRYNTLPRPATGQQPTSYKCSPLLLFKNALSSFTIICLPLRYDTPPQPATRQWSTSYKCSRLLFKNALFPHDHSPPITL